MLMALMGGEAVAAGELARLAAVSASGASAHLRRLREGGFVTEERVGRQRLFQLANPELAEALEALSRVAPPARVHNLRQSQKAVALKRARTCYDHLAGELGVAVTEALLRRGLLVAAEDSFAVSDAGASWFAALDVRLEALERRRRAFARACIDWSERRPHLAGSLGAAVAEVFLSRSWVRRLPGGRALAVSPAGRSWLEHELGLTGF